jgi:hypothetical protein
VNELRWSFDHVIANIGDHFGFHGAIPNVLGNLAATVIFHDGFIASLAGAYAVDRSDSAEVQRLLIRLTHGRQVKVEEADVWNAPLEEIAKERPMVEWLARLASGCITHSSVWADRLRHACAGPVEIIELCFPDMSVGLPRPIGQTLIISTVGHANSNKRADEVLRALASDPELTERCRYQLLGEIGPAERERLSSIAQTLKIPAPAFFGRLSADELCAAVAETDVIACLRHPVLEGGSASLITALFTARPTLVSNQAHYADMPEGLVLPCRPGDEAPDVAKHLRWILGFPDQAQELGLRARQYALVTHVKDRYVDELLDLAARATQLSPLVRAATKMGQLLGSIGAEPDDPSGRRIAEAFDEGLPSVRNKMLAIEAS